MSKGDNSPGLSKLAGVMVGMARNAMDTSLVLDFGQIQGDGSLLTNTYQIPIPASDYLVCRGCVLPNSEVITSYSTTAQNNSHRHKFDDALILEGTTDAQSSPESHSHLVEVPMLDIFTAYTTSTQKSHSHSVDIARPSQRMLKAGDRVLVAWVYNDAVVIDIIKSASEIFGSHGGDGGYG